MPVTNPLTDPYTADADPVVQQSSRAGAIAGPIGALVNPNAGTQTTTNAAGTSENVAAHVACIIVFALIGVYVLRQSGFKFVVAGSVGVGA